MYIVQKRKEFKKKIITWFWIHIWLEYISFYSIREKTNNHQLKKHWKTEIWDAITRATLSEYSGSKSVMSAVKCFIGVDVDTKRHDCCEGSCLRHKEPQLPRVRVTQTRLPVNQVDDDRCDTFLCHAKLNRFTNSLFHDSKSTLSGRSRSFDPQLERISWLPRVKKALGWNEIFTALQ